MAGSSATVSAHPTGLDGHPGTLAEPEVQAMFDRIAGLYDRMNTVMTAGLHRRWRQRAADVAALPRGGRALDVATGTGDFALELAARVGASGEVVGCDFSERMLELARVKGARSGLPVRFEAGNALSLPYEDDCFDAVVVGFGARNFSDLRRGLAEMARVARPGGRVVILEITTATGPPLSYFLDLWFEVLIPALGRLVSQGQAYSYLPSSVRRFPPPPQLAALMSEVGLSGVRWIQTAGGIIAIHVGTVA